jgi:hypothetical protein
LNREIFKPSSGTRWLVESAGIQLLHTGSGKLRFLACPLDAVWDLFARGYPFEKVCSMLELIAGASPEDSAALAASSLNSWRREGWIMSGEPK